MAENQSKSVRKMFRKKRFKKFENSFENYFENDLKLKSFLKNICLKQKLWKTFTESDDESDDDNNTDNDFLGFDSNSNRIQEMLQKKWQKRIKQLNQRLKETKTSIVRKARLEISSKTLQRIRSGHQCRSGQPGYITCAICGQTKYYSHVQRRYGVFSCEPCSKFFARFLKDPKQLFCSKKGDCPVITISAHRCRACWLKVCLQTFQIDSSLRKSISLKFSPKSSENQLSLITVDTNDSTKGQTSQRSCSGQPLLMVAHSSGPRVKRVCRRTVSGLPLATFGPQTPDSDSDSDQLPVDVYLCRAVAVNKKHRHSQGVKSA